jgi:uncharacterized membrane protein
MRHRNTAMLAAAVLAMLSVGVSASPALADCPANRFCLYEHAGYGGDEFEFNPSTTCYTTLPSGINNDANAMRNYESYRVRMWDLPGCGGDSTYTANAFSYDSDFGNNGFSNKASSLKRV